MDQDQRLWALPKDEAHDALVSVCDWLVDQAQGTKARAQRCIESFEGRRLGDALEPGAYAQDRRTLGNVELDLERYFWNYARSLPQAVQAKIAGKQRPKAQFLTTGADWATKRKAAKLDRFVEGVLHQPQGGYADAWELGQEVFLDACKVGLGAIKIYADADDEKIRMERVLVPGSLLVDPEEARFRNPLSLFHVYPYDQDSLLDQFPDQRDKLLLAERWENSRPYDGTRVCEQLYLREYWRLPDGDTPGRHIIATNNTTLVDEEWDRDSFPFLFIRWCPETLGFGATSLVEEIQDLSDEVNYSLARMRESFRLTAMGVCIYDEGGINEENLADNTDATFYSKKPGAEVQWVNPNPFGPAQLDWVKLNSEKVWEMPGVSQMSATSRKESGVTAAVAIRTLADMETERFSIIFRQYERLFVEMGKQIVACARDIAEANGGKFTVRWPGDTFLNEIDWEKVDLDEDQYIVQIAPVSGIKDTPADRLQIGQELFGAGIIQPEAYSRILEHLDPKSELEHINQQRKLIDRYIEAWLDATPEEIESNQTTEGHALWVPPITFMGHEDALIQVANAYMKAVLDGAPDANTELFLRYMEALDRQLTEKAARLAQIEQGIDPNNPQPAPPPGGPMPPAEMPMPGPAPMPAPPPMAA